MTNLNIKNNNVKKPSPSTATALFLGGLDVWHDDNALHATSFGDTIWRQYPAI
jgi:hypothetical protein